MTDVASALTGFDFIRTTFRRISELQKDNETLTAVNDALTKLGELQDKLYELRDTNLNLQAAVTNLSGQLDNRTAWEARKAAYKLVETAGGAHVYQNDGPPVHFACPACMERGQIHLLQNRRVVSGSWVCPGCDKQYPVSAPYKTAPRVVQRSDWLTRY